MSIAGYSCINEVLQEAEPGGAGFFGVELRRPHRTLFDRGRGRASVLAARRDHSVVGGLGRVRVHEVQPWFSAEVGTQSSALRDRERVPTDLGQAFGAR